MARIPNSEFQIPNFEALYRRAGAGRWGVAPDVFADALATSASRVFAERDPTSRELARLLESLHVEDLALAIACAAGHDAAWEHFVREYRSVLYRSADAIDPSGGARELSDSLYADLYGLSERDGQRRSLFRYYHGRSSLATWLRAVLAQRHVDRIRTERRVEPLPDENTEQTVAAATPPSDPDRPRLLAAIKDALAAAVSRLGARDRLRLSCYYAQELTLAQVGRLTGEHEATVSRQLARTRRTLRDDVERQLRDGAKLSDAEISQGFGYAMEDAGPIDLGEILNSSAERKKSAAHRSI
jgi:RNA polymerase sigma-70 factor (ECF subfamily)